MITKLLGSSGRFLGYEVSGEVRESDEHLWVFGVEESLEMHAKVSVLLMLRKDAGWGVKAGLKDLKWVLQHLTKFERIAIVSDSKVWNWLVSVDRVFAQFVGIKERHFKSSELDQAWRWLKAS